MNQMWQRVLQGEKDLHYAHPHQNCVFVILSLAVSSNVSDTVNLAYNGCVYNGKPSIPDKNSSPDDFPIYLVHLNLAYNGSVIVYNG